MIESKYDKKTLLGFLEEYSKRHDGLNSYIVPEPFYLEVIRVLKGDCEGTKIGIKSVGWKFREYYCGNCGTTIQRKDKYCHECGEPLNWPEGDNA